MSKWRKIFPETVVEGTTLEINSDSKVPIIAQINKILFIHLHICKIGSIDFNDSEGDSKTYYFGSQSIMYTKGEQDKTGESGKTGTDYEAGYTYIKGKIMNNSIQLSLLSPLPIKGGNFSTNKDQNNKDEDEDEEQYDTYDGGGYEDEDEYEYEDKYVDF